MPRILAVALSVAVFHLSAISQSVVTTTAPTSDPQALTLATAAMTALSSGQQVSDVTLTGTATETAGATVNSGTATFKAKGYWESRIDFGGSNHSEIRSVDSSGHPIGAWTTPDGVSHTMAFHNVWTDAGLFFPVFSSLSVASQPNVTAKYIGQETRNGASVQHLRFFRSADATLAAAANDIPNLSRVDIFLDSVSSLPVAITFNAHPDNDASRDIQMEMDYTNYQSVSGVQIPFHVQKLLSGGVIVDFLVSQAALNSGLTDSTFSIQ